MKDSTEKNQPREDDRYLYGCGRNPQPYKFLFPFLDRIFQCTHETYQRCYRQKSFTEVEAADHDVLADRSLIVQQGYPGSSRPR